MKFENETNRLILRILTPSDADKTLAFYQKNASIFEKYEPIIGESFYTLEHQKNLLAYEYQQILHMYMLRFWLFEKSNPATPIGTISFRQITQSNFSCCQVGYKMDQDYWHRGYCHEALAACIPILHQDLNIRRFEALVLPDNISSIKLLVSLGFQKEGLLKEKIYLQDQWKDHYLYALLYK